MKKLKKGELTWDYRVINFPSENGGDDYFEVKEVHYTSDGMGYTDICAGAESLKGLKWNLNMMKHALKRPVLHENEFKYSPKHDFITKAMAFIDEHEEPVTAQDFIAKEQRDEVERTALKILNQAMRKTSL